MVWGSAVVDASCCNAGLLTVVVFLDPYKHGSPTLYVIDFPIFSKSYYVLS